MRRRVFLASGLAVVGYVRRVWAQVATASAPVRYTALTRPVTIPVDAVAEPWRPVSFVAEARLRATRFGAAGSSDRRVLISGMVFRTETDLSALCVTCPHEQCQVDLVTDAERLARMTGGTKGQPLFECGCHLSVFDAAAHGARVSGETPRGLYLFKIAGVRDGLIEITEIEEAALSDV